MEKIYSEKVTNLTDPNEGGSWFKTSEKKYSTTPKGNLLLCDC